jgi:hypothetical protein
MLSPNDPKKRDRKVYQKNIKLPPGMSTAEYKYLVSKYKFTEELLKESPDVVGEIDPFHRLASYYDNDAIAFG